MAEPTHPETPQQEPSAPIVSVLMVSFNCIEALRTSLSALESAPDRAEFEILVTDHGSTDGSQLIDTEFPEINVLRLPHFCGQTKARNIGLRTARGEFVLLLAPGIVLDPGAVTALAHRLESEAGVLAVCPTIAGADGKVVSRQLALPDATAAARSWRDPQAELGAGTGLHDGHAILLRRRTIQGINYLDERYGEAWGDVELAFQIRRAGKKILQVADIGGRIGIPEGAWKPSDSRYRAAFDADAANGAASYIGKHFGLIPALVFRIKLILGAFGKTITFQNPGYQVSLLSRLVSGYKIDGTSPEL
ncbi:MAG: glycosyltransferase [Bryobacteraceae bacterium]